MNALAALSYGDRRALLNALRALPRKPGRLLLWCCWALVVGALVFFRARAYGHTAVRHDGTALLFADLWLGAVLGGFGLVLVSGTHRFLGVFSSRAEALFLTSAELPPLLVAVYLQVRAVMGTLVQSIARFVYLVVVAVPAGSGVRGFALQAVFFASVTAAIASVALPRAMLRGAPRVLAQIAGAATLVAAAVPVFSDLAGGTARHVTVLRPLLAAWHPGRLLFALAAGDARAIAVPLAFAVAASAAFAYAARDRYPELYAISLANLEWRARTRERRSSGRSDARRASVAARSALTRALPGALAFVWADAIGFRRRVSPLLVATLAALALGAGAALAAFARTHSEAVLAALVFSMLPLLVVAFAALSGVRLAPLLRLPLFWLGDAPLTARLGAWTLGALWRDLTLVLLAAAGYVAVSRTLLAPLAFALVLGALLALLRAIGVAVFALFPNALDQRGPAVVVRTLLSYVLIAPPFVAGALAAFALRTPLVFGIAALVALAEAGGLIAFASWRLAGRVDTLSTA